MPWRRFRKKVERPIDVSKSIEESLQDAADGEEQEDLTELAELDDANVTEAGRRRYGRWLPREGRHSLRECRDRQDERRPEDVCRFVVRGSRTAAIDEARL